MFLCLCIHATHILVFVTSFLPFSIIFIFMMHKSSHFEVSCCRISFPVKFHGSSHFPGSHLQNSQRDINLKKQTWKVLHSPWEKCYVSQCHLRSYCTRRFTQDPPVPSLSFLSLGAFPEFASLGLALWSGSLTLYLCVTLERQLKYTISRWEWFSKIKNRQGAEKAGGVKCSLYPTISLMWWPCSYLVPFTLSTTQS